MVGNSEAIRTGANLDACGRWSQACKIQQLTRREASSIMSFPNFADEPNTATRWPSPGEHPRYRGCRLGIRMKGVRLNHRYAAAFRLP
jgi:hypothetical protein